MISFRSHYLFDLLLLGIWILNPFFQAPCTSVSAIFWISLLRKTKLSSLSKWHWLIPVKPSQLFEWGQFNFEWELYLFFALWCKQLCPQRWIFLDIYYDIKNLTNHILSKSRGWRAIWRNTSDHATLVATRRRQHSRKSWSTLVWVSQRPFF